MYGKYIKVNEYIESSFINIFMFLSSSYPEIMWGGYDVLYSLFLLKYCTVLSLFDHIESLHLCCSHYSSFC